MFFVFGEPWVWAPETGIYFEVSKSSGCSKVVAFGGCRLMFGAEKILRLSFARLSPVFAALGCALILAIGATAKTRGEAATAASVKRQSASTQFARAEEQRAALNSKPNEKRTLADYKLVVAAYRRVVLITPRAAEVPDSLLAAAELYTEMGDEQVLPECISAGCEAAARAVGRFRTREKNV
jgi:hypothetical protein